MSMFRWVGQGIVRRVGDATRMLPFARPDRAPGGPIRVEPARRSGPPWKRAAGGPSKMKPQHHVHPSDDEARRQDKG